MLNFYIDMSIEFAIFNFTWKDLYWEEFVENTDWSMN